MFIIGIMLIVISYTIDYFVLSKYLLLIYLLGCTYWITSNLTNLYYLNNKLIKLNCQMKKTFGNI